MLQRHLKFLNDVALCILVEAVKSNFHPKVMLGLPPLLFVINIFALVKFYLTKTKQK
jgi:hypothetical protein